MALRLFEGGDKMDIAPHHGVAFEEVMRSVYDIVEAINKCDELKMKSPESHEEQIEIAQNFQNKSSVHFDNCVDCIDHMLGWTEKSSEVDRCGSTVGSGKYFYGRGKNFEWFYKQSMITIYILLI